MAAVFLVALLIENSADAQDTSTVEVFVTEDGATATDPTTKAALDNWKLQKARTAKESRPAHLDPEGNWGEASAGMRMSIRLDKSSYKIGEPVDAAIFMRNLGQEPREYRVIYPDERGFGLSLFAQGRAAPVLSKIDSRATNEFGKVSRLPITKVGHFWLSPATQQKHEVRLDRIYDLTRPGSYLISASREIDDPETGGKSLISTKFAAFEIVPGDGPESRTNTPSIDFQGSPVMPPTEARQTGAVPGTSFQSKSGLPQNSEASAKPHPPVAPSLAEAGTSSTEAEKGWTWGILFAAIAAFVGSVVWVLWRRSRES